MATPFAYPDEPHGRKHGPLGYSRYRPYRPRLRDEFTFRCVYCLTREQWGRAKGMFDLDHFVPQAHEPQQRKQYDNLLYACRTCNRAKSDPTTPDPTQVLTAEHVQVHSDGSIDGLTPESERLIWLLDLDGDDYRQWRLTWMRIIDLAVGFGETEKCDGAPGGIFWYHELDLAAEEFVTLSRDEQRRRLAEFLYKCRSATEYRIAVKGRDRKRDR